MQEQGSGFHTGLKQPAPPRPARLFFFSFFFLSFPHLSHFFNSNSPKKKNQFLSKIVCMLFFFSFLLSRSLVLSQLKCCLFLNSQISV
uniref:Uncharacterized protein n=1 Tax=Anguilla anguilla TaxID=7936 RepID=A0A0E9X4Y5_ANGAN